ncbi:hypothetical protein PAEH1_02725 [Paenalcaligenes hominis]|uniref:Antitermination protein Q n=1 Tax=Paenalcaligenes hominis TaxID=643674 RepID=A0A1U9JYD9_9BURK|nr:hypothetical protein [Paenalcaligenes hominis]AQS50739.1 hypothetical protein PAEH1_02725 [Paenalcaligenes hominis]
MSKSNIEALLSEWGAWKRGENRRALGLPSQAAFHNVVVDGAGKVLEPDVLLVDDDLNRLDREIERLHSDYKVALVMHYIKAGPVKTKAYEMKVSVRSYYLLLENAHKVLSQAMGGIYLIGIEPKVCTHVARVCTQI